MIENTGRSFCAKKTQSGMNELSVRIKVHQRAEMYQNKSLPIIQSLPKIAHIY